MPTRLPFRSNPPDLGPRILRHLAVARAPETSQTDRSRRRVTVQLTLPRVSPLAQRLREVSSPFFHWTVHTGRATHFRHGCCTDVCHACLVQGSKTGPSLKSWSHSIRTRHAVISVTITSTNSSAGLRTTSSNHHNLLHKSGSFGRLAKQSPLEPKGFRQPLKQTTQGLHVRFKMARKSNTLHSCWSRIEKQVAKVAFYFSSKRDWSHHGKPLRGKLLHGLAKRNKLSLQSKLFRDKRRADRRRERGAFRQHELQRHQPPAQELGVEMKMSAVLEEQ